MHLPEQQPIFTILSGVNVSSERSIKQLHFEDPQYLLEVFFSRLPLQWAVIRAVHRARVKNRV